MLETLVMWSFAVHHVSQGHNASLWARLGKGPFCVHERVLSDVGDEASVTWFGDTGIFLAFLE